MAKELFNAWDTSRLGHISVITLAENLISFGLAMDEKQVIRLAKQLGVHAYDNKDDDASLIIQMHQFLRIFVKDSFGEKSIRAIKLACLSERMKKEEKRDEFVTTE